MCIENQLLKIEKLKFPHQAASMGDAIQVTRIHAMDSNNVVAKLCFVCAEFVDAADLGLD